MIHTRLQHNEEPGPPVIFLVGPTAIGKTECSLDLAETFGCEIIGVDSVQIYRYMDIGTAKPSCSERARVPHHLIDYVFPDEMYSASRFVEDCRDAIADIRERGKIPLLTGGTGLYFASLEHGIFQLPDVSPAIRRELQKELVEQGREPLWQELQVRDPQTAERIHPNDTYRLVRALEILRGTGIAWSQYIVEHQQRHAGEQGRVIKIGLARDRDELYSRINQRVEMMASLGLLQEVEQILSMGYPKDLRPLQSLGYRHMIEFLDGVWNWEEALELLARDTRRYAKRQMTWFRPDQETTWFHPEQTDQIKIFLDKKLTT